jgi:hypothetical protein
MTYCRETLIVKREASFVKRISLFARDFRDLRDKRDEQDRRLFQVRRSRVLELRPQNFELHVAHGAHGLLVSPTCYERCSLSQAGR